MRQNLLSICDVSIVNNQLLTYYEIKCISLTSWKIYTYYRVMKVLSIAQEHRSSWSYHRSKVPQPTSGIGNHTQDLESHSRLELKYWWEEHLGVKEDNRVSYYGACSDFVWASAFIVTLPIHKLDFPCLYLWLGIRPLNLESMGRENHSF